MNTVRQIALPEQLVRQAEALVTEGWSTSFDALVEEALRRFLESHRGEITEAFLREDVRWGLHGDK